MNGIGRIVKEVCANWHAMKLLPEPYCKHKIKYWFDSIHCIRKFGALSDDYISLAFYAKTDEERAKYVTSGNKRLFYKKFYDDEAREILASKYLFSKRYKDYVKRAWIYTGDVTPDEIRDFIKKQGRVVVKPLSSTWGIGVGIKTADDIDAIVADLKKGNQYMIEEVIVNHPDVARVNPDSVNTLRVETCLDAQGGFHLLNVLFMVGTAKTIVSNCHSGGMMCHVDVKTGCIDNAGYNPKGIWYEVHPASGIKLRGYKLPYIDQLEDYIKGVCQVMPNARYVGWDVVITPNGFELIEGNFCPGQCTQVCDGVPKYDMLKSYL